MAFNITSNLLIWSLAVAAYVRVNMFLSLNIHMQSCYKYAIHSMQSHICKITPWNLSISVRVIHLKHNYRTHIHVTHTHTHTHTQAARLAYVHVTPISDWLTFNLLLLGAERMGRLITVCVSLKPCHGVHKLLEVTSVTIVILWISGTVHVYRQTMSQ